MIINENIKKLERLLFEHTENELYYLSHPKSYSKRYDENYSARRFIDGKEVLEISVSDLKTAPIHIRKDSRYTFMPFHTYSNINLNYIYSGQCTYFIENKEIILNAGDICFFDTQVVRAKMKPDYNDIIINIVMENLYFKSLLTVDDTSLLSKFMSKTLYSNSSHNNYIIFKTGNNSQIRKLFQDLLTEQYSDRTYKIQAIQYYFSLIFLELLYLGDSQTSIEVHFSDSTSNNVFSIVNFIEKNYKTTNLKEISNIFGYHEKYLSTLLKKNYGKAFKEIQIEKRLAEVERYLINSSLTVNEIAEYTGFSNLNQLYRTFKSKNKMLPNEYRKKFKSISSPKE